MEKEQLTTAEKRDLKIEHLKDRLRNESNKMNSHLRKKRTGKLMDFEISSLKRSRCTQKYQIIILCSIFFLIPLGIISGRSLYADQVYFFYDALKNQNYVHFLPLDSSRGFALPALTALTALTTKLGLSDIKHLFIVHSFSFIGVQIIIYLLALSLHIKRITFWLLLAIFSVTYLLTGFFSGEASLGYSLATLCLSLLLLPEMFVWQKILLIPVSLLMSRCYETIAILAVPLVILASIKFISCKTIDRNYPIEKIYWTIVIVLFLHAIYQGFHGFFYYISSENKVSALSTAVFFLSRSYIVGFYWLALMVCWLFSFFKLPGKVVHPLLKNIILLAPLLLLTLTNPLTPWDQFGYRAWVAFFAFPFFAVGVLIQIRPCLKISYDSIPQQLSCTIIAALFIFLISNFIQINIQYMNYIKNFEERVAKLESWQKLPNDLQTMSWSWTHHIMSIILRGDNTAGFKGETSNWEPTPEIYDTKKNPLANYTKSPIWQ